MITAEVVSLLSESASLVLSNLLDSDAAYSERKRKKVVIDWINSLVTKCLGHRHRTFPVGSLLANICPSTSSVSSIPTSSCIEESIQSNVDLSFCLNSRNSSPWFLNVCESLCEHSSSADKKRRSNADLIQNDRGFNQFNPEITSVERISYFPSDARLEAVVNKVSVNLVPNDFISFGFSVVLEKFNSRISSENLFKRCVLFIKAWCLFEAPTLVSRQGLKGACDSSLEALKIIRNEKAVEVMIMWLFNSKLLNDGALHDTLFEVLQNGGKEGRTEGNSDPGFRILQNPFLILVFFLKHFSQFNYAEWAIGVTGLMPIPKESTPRCEEGNGVEEAAEGSIVTAPHITKGGLGLCDEVLTAMVDAQRVALRDQKNPFLCSISTQNSSTSAFTESPSSNSTPLHTQVETEVCLTEQPFDILPSDCFPSQVPDLLPQDLRLGDVCVVHPLSGLNLCKSLTPYTHSDGQNHPVHTALKTLLACGLEKIVTSIRDAAGRERGDSSEEKEGRGPEGGSVCGAGALRLSEACYPALFTACRTHASCANTDVPVSDANHGGVSYLSCMLHSDLSNLAAVLDASAASVDLVLPSPTPSRGVPVNNTHTHPPKPEAPIDSPAAGSSSSTTGTVTPQGQWGDVQAYRGGADSMPFRMSNESSRSSTSPTDGHRSEQSSLEKAILAIKQKDHMDRGPDSHTLGSQGPQPQQRMESPPGPAPASAPAAAPRGSPPVFVPKVGAFIARVPPHNIQTYIKKEEQVWVPGKFSKDQSNSPVPGIGVMGAGREGSFSSMNNASMISKSVSRDSVGWERSMGGRLPNGAGMAARSMSGGIGGYIDQSGYSANANPSMSSGLGLGPGLLTGKTAIIHTRSLDGSLTGAGGVGAGTVENGSYPFLSNYSTPMRSDSMESQQDSEYSTERYRANQMALTSRQQVLSRHKTAQSQSQNQSQNQSLSLSQPYSRMPSPGGEDYYSPGQGLTPPHSGPRSPVVPTLLQLRMSNPQSQSSSHLQSHMHLHPPPTRIQQVHSTTPPPQHHTPLAVSDFDLLKQSYKVGFEAQLPSFLRDL